MTIADAMFDLHIKLLRAESDVEEAIEKITDFDDMGHDYYDQSVVLYRDPPLPELTREQVGAILDLGFATIFERRGGVMWQHLRDRSAVVPPPTRPDPFRDVPPIARF